jgi:hypothetical protein
MSLWNKYLVLSFLLGGAHCHAEMTCDNLTEIAAIGKARWQKDVLVPGSEKTSLHWDAADFNNLASLNKTCWEQVSPGQDEISADNASGEALDYKKNTYDPILVLIKRGPAWIKRAAQKADPTKPPSQPVSASSSGPVVVAAPAESGGFSFRGIFEFQQEGYSHYSACSVWLPICVVWKGAVACFFVGTGLIVLSLYVAFLIVCLGIGLFLLVLLGRKPDKRFKTGYKGNPKLPSLRPFVMLAFLVGKYGVIAGAAVAVLPLVVFAGAGWGMYKCYGWYAMKRDVRARKEQRSEYEQASLHLPGSSQED